MKRKMMSFLLAAAVIFVSTGSALAIPASATNDANKIVHEFAPIPTQNMKTYVDASAYETGDGSVSVSPIANFNVQITADEVRVSLKLDNQTLCFSGKVYAFGQDGSFNEKLIVGDFVPSGQFNVAQFKVKTTDKASQVSLLLENMNTGEIEELIYSITTAQYEELLSVAKRETQLLVAAAEKNDEDPRLAVYAEIMPLMMPTKQYCSVANADAQRSWQSNYTFKSTSYYSAISADYEDDFEPFFEDLNADGVASPSAKMKNILNQTGWKLYKGSDMFYVMHGVANTSTEQLVGITVAQLSPEKIPNSPKVKASYTILHSVTLSYDKISQEADVLFYNAGIRLEDASVAVELVGGTTNFHYAWKSQTLDGNNETLNALYAIFDKLGTASAIWDALTPDPEETSDNVDYGTDTEQNRLYKGLVGATGNQTDDGTYLWSEGNKISIMGEYYSNKTYSSYRYAYGFIAYSLI